MPKSITNGLSNSGKRVVSDGKTFSKETDTIPPHTKEGHRPGYQGFLRGQQHYYGTTYGETSRATNSHQFGPNVLGNPVDEVPPNANEHVATTACNCLRCRQRYTTSRAAGRFPSGQSDIARRPCGGIDRRRVCSF